MTRGPNAVVTIGPVSVDALPITNGFDISMEHKEDSRDCRSSSMKQQRITWSLWIALLAVSWAACGQQKKPIAGKVEDDVLAIQNQFVEGMRSKNVTALNRIIADDFVGVGAGGHTAGKAQMLDFHEGPTSFTFVKMENPLIKVFDNGTAVVIGAFSNFDVDCVNERSKSCRVRFTMVFCKRGNEWKLVAGQLVPVPEE